MLEMIVSLITDAKCFQPMFSPEGAKNMFPGLSQFAFVFS